MDKKEHDDMSEQSSMTEWVERLYDVRMEPDKLLIMIENKRAELRRAPAQARGVDALDSLDAIIRGHVEGPNRSIALGALAALRSRIDKKQALADHWVDRATRRDKIIEELQGNILLAADIIDDLRSRQSPQATCEVLLSRGMDQPWSMRDCIVKLCEAADILLDRKGYDGHGHEEIATARNTARGYLAAALQPSPQGEDALPCLADRPMHDEEECANYECPHFNPEHEQNCSGATADEGPAAETCREWRTPCRAVAALRARLDSAREMRAPQYHLGQEVDLRADDGTWMPGTIMGIEPEYWYRASLPPMGRFPGGEIVDARWTEKQGVPHTIRPRAVLERKEER